MGSAEQGGLHRRGTLYRVHSLPVRPEFFVLAPPLESAVVLTPEAWRASF